MRSWDPRSGQTIDLDGEWDFAWDMLASSGGAFPDSSQRASSGAPAFVQVPGDFAEYHDSAGERLPAFGYASYRIRLLLPDTIPALAVRILSPGSASVLFVNGKRVASLGQVGTSEVTSHPRFGTMLARVTSVGGVAEIVVQVSNWHHHLGGLVRPVELGLQGSFELESLHDRALRVFMAGALLLMTLYHAILYAYRRKDRIHLVFTTIAVTAMVRVLVPSDHLVQSLVPWLDYSTLIRIEYFTMLLVIAMLASFLREFFSRIVPSIVVKVFLYAFLCYGCFALFAPLPWVTASAMFAHLVNLSGGLLLIWYISRAVRNGDRRALVLLAALLFLFGTVLNDVLMSARIVSTGYYSSIGLFFLVFSQWILLADRYSDTVALLERQREQFLRTMADAIESRDDYTGGHVDRVACYSRDLALSAAGFTTLDAHELYLAATVHDVGKIGIRDAVLNKPGKLEPEEMAHMQEHSRKGYELLSPLIDATSEDFRMLDWAAMIALRHQERYNGKGYPDGIHGEKIPLVARIVAVADYWDAIRSNRPYRKAMPVEKAIGILIRAVDCLSLPAFCPYPFRHQLKKL